MPWDLEASQNLKLAEQRWEGGKGEREGQLHPPTPPLSPMPAPSRPWLPPQLHSHPAQPLPLALQLTPACPRPCPVLGPTAGLAAPRLVDRAQPPAGWESLQNLGALGAEHLSWI